MEGRVFWRSFVTNEHTMSRPHYLLRQSEPLSADESSPRVFLERLGLSQYAQSFEEEGYMDMTLIRSANANERREILNDELNMKVEHAQILVDALERFLPDRSDPLER